MNSSLNLLKSNVSKTDVVHMNILHIWDQAGVACILAKYQELSGHKSKVIVTKTRDKFGIYSFYHQYTQTIDPRLFIDTCLKEAETADVLHIHGRIDMLFRLHKKFGRSKKLVLHYHGTDLRGLKKRQKEELPHRSLPSDLIIFAKRLVRRPYYKIMRRRIHARAQKLADAVIVATPDLLQFAENAIHLPNPIDTDHFKPLNNMKCNNYQQQVKILTINNEAIDMELVLSYCRKNGLNSSVEVYDRMNNPIMYSDMPNFLRNYDIYLDARFINRQLIEGMSKTALESLACGLSVIDHQLNRQKGLPPEHDPIYIVSRLSNIYNEAGLVRTTKAV
jgi:hypothetical protein